MTLYKGHVRESNLKQLDQINTLKPIINILSILDFIAHLETTKSEWTTIEVPLTSSRRDLGSVTSSYKISTSSTCVSSRLEITETLN